MTGIKRYELLKPGKCWLVLILLSGIVLPVVAAGPVLVPEEISLKGLWKFKIGDQEQWASSGYDDSDWAQIRVPARWEDAGYQGYDGFAWYRTWVVVPREMKDRPLVLHLGYVDDTDEVFFNGKKIGQSGTFPPHYTTAYNALRAYQIPGELLNYGGENLVAVRVYDSHLEGGIVAGDTKILVDRTIPPFDIILSGEWLFNKGTRYEPTEAVKIYVPGAWENQGFYDYDGYAVYTRKVKVPAALTAQRLVLVAGRIDDVDQLVINGRLAGETGDYHAHYPATMYGEQRNYFILPELLKKGEENLIEIRVRDTGGKGGIVEGPVGIITQDKFRQYWKSKSK